jgi:Tfp pilus assembly protein PilN
MPTLINLLPDSKQDRLKAARTRQLAISLSIIVLIVAVAVPVILLVIKGSQALYLNRTQDQIDERKAKVKSFPNIVTMLTVKDHLESLPALYQQRLLTSKLVDYLPKLLPADVRLTDLEVSDDGSLQLSGTSPSYSSVEKLFVALQRANDQFDENKVDPDPNKTGDFTEVVLEDVSGPSGDEVTFTIKARFDNKLITSGDNDAE